MLKANGHIAVWWFFFVCVCVCVCFAMFVLACHSGFLEGYYFSMLICMLFVWKIEVTSELAGGGRSMGWGEPGNERWRWGGDKRVEELSDDGERKLGKGGWWGGGRKMERGGALIHLKTSISHRPVSAQTCSDRPRTSWSRGHWIVLAISFISRHCNALDCVDK